MALPLPPKRPGSDGSGSPSESNGTGGSSGSEYLRSRLPLRYYPLLWGLRSEL